MRRPMQVRTILYLWLSVVVIAAPAVPAARAADRARDETALDFNDVPTRAKEFIGYYHSISLTPEQQKLKERALGAIAAPCCKDYSILTCCCPCNLAKTVWGLAQHAIAKRGYDEAQLKKAVLGWLRAVNASGFSGTACYQGGCGKAFAANGCGGMDERHPVF